MPRTDRRSIAVAVLAVALVAVGVAGAFALSRPAATRVADLPPLATGLPLTDGTVAAQTPSAGSAPAPAAPRTKAARPGRGTTAAGTQHGGSAGTSGSGGTRASAAPPQKRGSASGRSRTGGTAGTSGGSRDTAPKTGTPAPGVVTPPAPPSGKSAGHDSGEHGSGDSNHQHETVRPPVRDESHHDTKNHGD